MDLVLWFDFTHTHIHTNIHNTLRPINWHTYIKMHLHHLPCVHSSCLYHTLNNSLISKVYFPMSFLFKNYSLVEVVYFHIRCNKTKFFLWNTNNTDKNDANKKNTHTKHLEKDNTGKGRGEVPTMSLAAFEFLFLTLQEKQVMRLPLFWTWDLSLNRNQLLFEKILRVKKL